ncbi:putative disease resistance RPP13-like protein 1 [Vitis vinifera]|uniref:Putative disease resistance RPP13-like protein 1 n=1 Tax=Vitis vinifera TaxID=29760 RepID=A0A438D520_VITVI|nr:putative disease resistance RPP13-like protein 1 [Vitis vinifera]
MAGAVAGGGALLSASLQVLFDRMASRDVLTFLREQELSATLLTELKTKFLAVKAVLNDAEAKQIANSDVKDWVDELKDAVYDAEDLLDEITTEALRCEMESDSHTTATQVPNIIPALLNSSDEGIESRVKGITETLVVLAKRIAVLGLKEGVGENLSERWPTTSLVDESKVYGRDDNKEKIVDFLLSRNASGNKIGVIALVGIGGIGKTTLAQLAYNDRRVEECFDLKAWERLNRKKFLIVLDDVWDENYNNWDRLQTPFTVGLPGNSYPLTTAGRYSLAAFGCEDPRRLRHLDIRHGKVKEIPSQMGQLKSIQKLTNYRVGKKSGTRVGELRELSHIGGILSIEELQKVVDGGDASGANLVGKRYLDDLQLEWNDGCGVEQNGADIVLNNLQPHSNLKRLTIQGYGGLRFPDWLEGPAILINMVSLRLSSCKNVSAFPPLGLLPCLKHLYISGAEEVETVGAEFFGTDSSSTKPSFVSLKALSFNHMPKWKEWLCLGGQGGEFPRLKELDIKDCPKLSGDLPNHLPLLTKLEIEKCEQLVAPLPRVPAIRELETRNNGVMFFRSPASDFKRLESLITSDISQWTELPPVLQKLSIENADSLESLLEEEILQSNTCLQDLTITKCSFSRTLRRVCLPITLKSLHIYELKNLELLVPEFFKCHFSLLETLDIFGSTCNSLCFPLSPFPRLTGLVICRLKGLESLSFSISEGNPTSFDHLSISGCPNLVSIELPALNVSRFFIGHCKNLKSLLHKAPCFQSLGLEACPELTFPIQGLPSNLTSLLVINCEKFRSQMELGLQGLTSLRHFSILSECEDLELFPKECLLPSTLTSLHISHLPNLKSLDSKGLQLLTTLQKLEISDCPKLQSLTEEGLPTSLSDSKGLQLLTSLQNLHVTNCPKLQSLTEEGLPTSLSFLTIENCPLLKERCKFGTAEGINSDVWLIRLLRSRAFLAASFEVDGPHSCCEGHSLVTSPERPPRIWSGTADWYIRFWSTTNGNHLNHVDKGSQVCNLAWSKNVNELVSTHGYSQNQILVWKHPSMTKVTTLTGHSLLVLYLAMSWDGQAEKWRRDRINSQLATLSKLIPKSKKR